MDEPWKKVGRVKCVTQPSEEEHDRKENATGEKKKKVQGSCASRNKTNKTWGGGGARELVGKVEKSEEGEKMEMCIKSDSEF